MRSGKRLALPVLALALVIAAAVPLGGAAAPPPEDTADRPHSDNMRLVGASLRPGAVTGPPPAGPGTVPWDTRNTDLAFWGDTVIQGRYDGFRVIDVSNKNKPEELALFSCVSPQGDVGVYGDLVFRAVDSPQMTDQCTAVSQNGSPDRRGLRAGAVAVHRLRRHPDLRHRRPEQHPAHRLGRRSTAARTRTRSSPTRRTTAC